MLTELHIRDLAIIEEVHLPLGPGFIVFTGETGAGKSILIDAVELLLGGRAETTMIRTGASAAWMEGTFQVAGASAGDLRELLEAEGLMEDPQLVTLAREIRKEGRSICRVNGRSVNLSVLKSVGDLLVDVHGQSEHLSLLRVREHLHLLDRYAQTDDLRRAFGADYARLEEIRKELGRLREGEREAVRRSEMLRFQVNEIEAAKLRPGEDVQLREERIRLANAEQLANLADQASAALDGEVEGTPSAADRLGQAAEAIAALARIDAGLQDLQAEAQATLEQVADQARRLQLYREGIEFSPRRLDEVEERLGLIHTLERKYGAGIPEVLAYGEKASRELELIEHAEERIQSLETEAAKLLAKLGEVGGRLSEARRRAAKKLGSGAEAELADLRMEGARVSVEVEWQEDSAGAPVGGRTVAFGATGLDRVEFLVAPNPGEGVKPLVKVASGGETSRLMLALKGVLARADRTPTLIFDEIDQGIGGRVGAVVGEKLWGLARDHQVLCVTHLPQLAAFADLHFRVEKVQRAGRTFTTVGPMSEDERVGELAQMLGGSSETNRTSAADLLSRAAEAKRSRLAGGAA